MRQRIMNLIRVSMIAAVMALALPSAFAGRDPICPIALSPSLSQMLQVTQENPDARALVSETQKLGSQIGKVETRVAEMLPLLKKRDALMQIDQLAEAISYCRSEVERCSLSLRVRVKAALEHLDEVERMRSQLQQLMHEIDNDRRPDIEKDRIEIQKTLLELDRYQISLRQSLKGAQQQTQSGQNLKFEIMKLRNAGAPSKALDLMDEKATEKWLMANPSMQADGASPKLKALIQSEDAKVFIEGATEFFEPGKFNNVHDVTDFSKVTDADVLYMLEHFPLRDFKKSNNRGVVNSNVSALGLLSLVTDIKLKHILSDEKRLTALAALDRVYDYYGARQFDDFEIWKKEEERKNLHLAFAKNFGRDLKNQIIEAADHRLSQVKKLFDERGYTDASWKLLNEPIGTFYPGQGRSQDYLKDRFGSVITYRSSDHTELGYGRNFGNASSVWDSHWSLNSDLKEVVFVSPFEKTKNLKLGDHFKVKANRSEKADGRLIGFFSNGDVLLKYEERSKEVDYEKYVRLDADLIERTRSDSLRFFPNQAGKFDELFKKYKKYEIVHFVPDIQNDRKISRIWRKIDWIDKNQGHIVSDQSTFFPRDEVVVRKIFDPKLKALGIKADKIMKWIDADGAAHKYFVFGTFLDGNICVGELLETATDNSKIYHLDHGVYFNASISQSKMPKKMPLEEAQKARPATLTGWVRSKL